jgi:glycosyltransferase involved in cell wall biosynthesis
MKISIITPIYNNSVTLEKSLTAIINLKTDYLLKIIVVDDGSTDNSFAIAQDMSQKHENILIIPKKNGGEASALNEGLKYCTGNYIATIEGDVEPEPAWLEKIMPEFSNSDVAGVGGYLVTPKTDNWIARLAGYEIELKLQSNKKYVPHITSANAIYRSEIVKNFGYNEKLINASLDVDLNEKIIESGKKLVFIKEAKVIHHYKTNIFSYFKRQFLYSFFRPCQKKIILYPYDKFLKYNVLACGLTLLSFVLLFVNYKITIICLFLCFLLQLPYTIKLLFTKKDLALIFYPFLIILRNWLAFIGVGMGFIYKLRIK